MGTIEILCCLVDQCEEWSFSSIISDSEHTLILVVFEFIYCLPSNDYSTGKHLISIPEIDSSGSEPFNEIEW